MQVLRAAALLGLLSSLACAISTFGLPRPRGTAWRPQQGAPSNPNGKVTEAWVQRVDGSAHGSDHAHDVRTDAMGNVIVAGWVEEAGLGNPDAYTVKYSPDGTLLWAKTYTGSAAGLDYGYALTLDQDGNVYVGGFGNGASLLTYDLFVLKYDSDGNEVWTQRWTSPIQNYSAYAYSIAVDSQQNVYVTGFESDGFADGRFITLKYDSGGILQWAKDYNGSPTQIDYANHIVVDDAGNSYITGWSGGANNLHDITTIKYGPDGDELWVKRYNGSADDNDYGYRLALNSSGNVYVAGQSVETGSDNDITTIKYSPDGNELWIRHYNGPANGYDAGQAIAVDAEGNAYVTGNHTTAGGLDCATLKYSPNGELLWTASFDGPDNGADVLFTIALDDSANAYVGGFVSSGGAIDIVTIKYDSAGNEQWAQLYNGPANSFDGPYAIALDAERNVLVSGYSTGIGTDYDWTVIKYTQAQSSPTPTPTPTTTPSITPNPTVTPRPIPTPRLRPTPAPRPTPRP